MTRLHAAGVAGTEAAVTPPQVIIEPMEPTFRAITRQTRTARNSTIIPPKETLIRGPENQARSRHTGLAERITIMVAITVHGLLTQGFRVGLALPPRALCRSLRRMAEARFRLQCTIAI